MGGPQGGLTPRSEHIVFYISIDTALCMHLFYLLSKARQCMLFHIYKMRSRYYFLDFKLQKHFRMAIFLKVGGVLARFLASHCCDDIITCFSAL